MGRPGTSVTVPLSLSDSCLARFLTRKPVFRWHLCREACPEPLLLAASPPSTPLCYSPEPALGPSTALVHQHTAYRLTDSVPLLHVTGQGGALRLSPAPTPAPRVGLPKNTRQMNEPVKKQRRHKFKPESLTRNVFSKRRDTQKVLRQRTLGRGTSPNSY